MEFSDRYTFIITTVVKSAGQYGNFLDIDRISLTNKTINFDKVGYVAIRSPTRPGVIMDTTDFFENIM